MGRLKRSCVCIFLAAQYLASTSAADTVTVTENFSPAAQTRFPSPLPSGSVGTTFASYTGSAVP